ncbi:M16 family metallopeptidase [Parvularcula oceani]|uniref:M16 family metallopeptidase n=1 Tax=Parvularcula oceani TaxID=1247963 RepID=UPI00068FC8E0|nr:pitrilysin family protein [Parvularcula oceani]
MSKALLASAFLTASALGLAAAPAVQAQTSGIEVELPYEEFTLDNGLKVVVHEDRKAPVVAVQVMYGVGSKDEPQGKTGFAHLFEHLMFNGSENFDKDFFVALKDMGATQYNGTTNTDRTNYYETVPRAALERILFLESDRMGHLLGAVTQEKLENQIGVVQNEKRLGEDRPFGRRIWTEIYENLYPVGHPYHHSTIGSMEDLDNASLEDVQEWFRQYYGAANAVLVLAGDISADEARPLVEKYFGDIEAGPPLLKPVVDSVPLEANKYGMMQDRVAQPRIYRAYIAPPTGSADSPLLDVMARALGGGKTSRLYRRLVDEMQIANSASVFYGEDILSGQIFFIVDAKTEADIPQINAVIDEEIAQFLKRGPTRDELERTKTIYLASEVRSLEGVSGKAAKLARGALFMDDPDYYTDENLDLLQAATPKSVQEAAQRYLTKGFYELQVLPFPDYAASAEGVDRAAGLPGIGEGADVSFPEIQTATLDNGMKVVVAPRPTVPVVEVAVQFDAGTATSNVPVGDNEEPIPGLPSMAVNLMDEGTRRMDAQEIATRSEELGAQISVYNSRDDSKAYLSSLKANLRPSLELFSSIVEEASFPEEEIEKFRKRTIDDLRQEKADVQSLGFRALGNAVFGEDHAYGTPMTAEEEVEAIRSITRDDLLAWKSAWLRPENATIYVTGDTSVEEILPELERAFGDFTAEGEPASKSIDEVQVADTPRVIVIDKPDTQQALILAGRLIDPTGSETDTALEAMNDAFGGNFLSRINMNLREDKGWSYGVRSGAGDALGQRMFYLWAPVQIDQAGPSVAELTREMEELVGGERPIEQAELDQTVAGVVGALPGKFETARSVLFSMMGNAVYGRPLDYDTTEAERYNTLKTDDLQAAAESVIDPDSLVWVIVGDYDEIEPQLQGLDLGPVEVRALSDVAAD